LLVLRINFLGLQVRLFTTFSVIGIGDCIRPYVRKKRQRKEQFGDVIARNGTWSTVIRRNPSLLGSKRISRPCVKREVLECHNQHGGMEHWGTRLRQLTWWLLFDLGF
jgi:hypothetical protein